MINRESYIAINSITPSDTSVSIEVENYNNDKGFRLALKRSNDYIIKDKFINTNEVIIFDIYNLIPKEKYEVGFIKNDIWYKPDRGINDSFTTKHVLKEVKPELTNIDFTNDSGYLNLYGDILFNTSKEVILNISVYHDNLNTNINDSLILNINDNNLVLNHTFNTIGYNNISYVELDYSYMDSSDINHEDNIDYSSNNDLIVEPGYVDNILNKRHSIPLSESTIIIIIISILSILGTFSYVYKNKIMNLILKIKNRES